MSESHLATLSCLVSDEWLNYQKRKHEPSRVGMYTDPIGLVVKNQTYLPMGIFCPVTAQIQCNNRAIYPSINGVPLYKLNNVRLGINLKGEFFNRPMDLGYLSHSNYVIINTGSEHLGPNDAFVVVPPNAVESSFQQKALKMNPSCMASSGGVNLKQSSAMWGAFMATRKIPNSSLYYTKHLFNREVDRVNKPEHTPIIEDQHILGAGGLIASLAIRIHDILTNHQDLTNIVIEYNKCVLLNNTASIPNNTDLIKLWQEPVLAGLLNSQLNVGVDMLSALSYGTRGEYLYSVMSNPTPFHSNPYSKGNLDGTTPPGASFKGYITQFNGF
uniref:Capsid triplex protein 2 n=1 Tax=Lake sturgeon herpesvirus TaxID=2922427 RepID=A0A9E9JW33_9VIRU|nr:capsid triplex protein 2 [Lake sturgeon herpesvirus]